MLNHAKCDYSLVMSLWVKNIFYEVLPSFHNSIYILKMGTLIFSIHCTHTLSYSKENENHSRANKNSSLNSIFKGPDNFDH